MKKETTMIAVVLTLLSLTSFGFRIWPTNTLAKKDALKIERTAPINDFWNPGNIVTEVDLVYHVDHRFATTITKEMLHKARSIIDILPKNATKQVETYQNARVSILYDEQESTVVGVGDLLNSDQLALLQKTNYSSNIRITSICQKRNSEGDLEPDSLVYYMTVIPEKVAEFSGGERALIKYLKEKSREAVAIIKEDERQPSRVSFTITRAGTIADVHMTGTTGYVSVDKALVDLIAHMPKKWRSASDSKGDRVDQQLVFFFGLHGC